MARVFSVAQSRVRAVFSVAFAASAAGVAIDFEPAPALALGYFSSSEDQPRPARRTYGRRGSKATPSAREAKRAETKSPERPLFAVISIADQRVSIYNHHGLVERSAISTGVPGHPTPKGVFTIIGRERFHHSNIYSGAPMPFMQRLTWSGIAMHLGVVPGHPASHGCIRLPAGFAARLWGLTRIGERVVISPHDVAPAEFTHPLLPEPKMRAQTEAEQKAPTSGPQASVADAEPQLPVNPRRYAEQLKAKTAADAAAAVKTAKDASAAVDARRQEAARAAAELRLAEAAHASAQAKADAATKAYEAAAEQSPPAPADIGQAEAERLAERRDQALAAKTNAEAALADAAARLESARTASAGKIDELAEAVRRASEARAASESAAKAEKEALLRLSPVSVLVSKKDRRIYVRQGLTPLFDAPATVRDPESPLGSHLYIATSADDGGASLKWSVVSMPTRGGEEQRERRRRTASIDEGSGSLAKPYGFVSSPAEALERIEIAPDVRDRIAERLWTGASMIISDQPLSGETGAVGTDLTVKLR